MYMNDQSVYLNNGAKGSSLPDRPRSLLDSFRKNARERPAEPALIWGREAVTYRQLHAMASRALIQLGQLGLAEQDTVGILAPKSPQSIALILACLMARLRFLLPPVDLAGQTLRALLQQAGCKHVLAPDTGPSAPSVELVDHLISTQPRAADPASAPLAPGQDDVSFLLTTSGSTGLPKIVPLTVGAVDRFADWASDRFDIRAGKTVLNYAPLNFDLCLLDIWTTLKLGGCVVLVDPQRATNAGYLLDLLTDREVHILQAVPMLYQLLVDATRETGQHFDAVEHVIFTGYSIAPRCLTELPRLFGRARLYDVYGCTETNDSFLHEVDTSVSPGTPVPLGQPLPGVQALVVGEDGKVLDGVGTGELLVATPFQTHGYANRALNDSKFVHHPEGRDRLRYFRSGDLVRRREDGSLTLEGRKDFLVKVRGVGVNMGEVERVLLEHGQVVEAAVVAVPDSLAGHRLHALIRRASPSGLNSLILRRHCAERLPRTAIPSTLRIVEDPLPRTSTGKVDRNLIQRTQAKEH